MANGSYKTPDAMEMAVKAAAKASSQDTNQALLDYYHDRFLSRIFSEDDPRFILKGGRGMLARLVDVRRTRDTDIFYSGDDIGEAVDELVRLGGKDLDDFLTYRLESLEVIVEEQGYRSGKRLRFTPVLGGTKEIRPHVVIDLVVDPAVVVSPDVVNPVNSLVVKGIDTPCYLVFPVANAVADKVVATMLPYPNGSRSSRVKDLVDLVRYVLSEELVGDYLRGAVCSEFRLRGAAIPDAFSIPDAWRKELLKGYRKLAKEARLPKECLDVEYARDVVARCLDPALSGDCVGCVWSPERLRWE